MTEVNTADPVGDVGGDTPPATTDPAPTMQPSPAPVAAPEPAPVQSDGDYYRIPKQSIAGFPDGWHGVVRRAKDYDQHATWFPLLEELSGLGASPESVRAILLEAEQGTDPPAADPNAPATPDDRPLTRAQMREEMTSYFDERDTKQRTESDKEDKARVKQEARTAETTFRDQVMTSLELDDKGQQPRRAKSLWGTALVEAIQERYKTSLPTHFTREQVAEAMAGATSAQATPVDLERASEIFLADWADFTNEAVASFAEKNRQVPSGTLAGGPGGPSGTPDYSNMGVAEYDALPESEKTEPLVERYRRTHPE